MATDGLADFIAGWCSGGAAVLVCQPVDTVLTRYQAGASLLGLQPAEVRPVGVARGLVTQAGVQSLWRGSSAMIGAIPLQNAMLMSGYGLGKRWSEEHNQPILAGVFLGGCTGGVVQSILMSPVELIKVQQQVVGKRALSAATAVTKGLLSPFAWRGLGATLLRDGIPHGIWFASYEVAKDHLGTQIGGSPDHDTVTVPLLSGAFAATVAWGVGYPADLIKTRIQAGGTAGIWGTAMELRNEPGGLYRGFGLKLVRAVPASMIGFVVYEYVKGKVTGVMS